MKTFTSFHYCLHNAHSQLSIHKVHVICFTSHKSAWFQTLYFLFQNPLFMSSSQQSFCQLYTDIIVELLNIYTAMFSTIVLYLISINCRYLLVGTVWLVKTLADEVTHSCEVKESNPFLRILVTIKRSHSKKFSKNFKRKTFNFCIYFPLKSCSLYVNITKDFI